MLSEVILKDAKTAPQTIEYKLERGLATLVDQEEALKNPKTAYYFALQVASADIKKCQETACKNPMWAYHFARDIPGADIKYCQDAALKDAQYAYWFATGVPGANVELCEKVARTSNSDPDLMRYFIENQQKNRSDM